VTAALVVLPAAAFRDPVASRRPVSVRLTFNSDPAGASVLRADGVVLGMTPLSADVPYAEVRTEYVLHKPGFVPTHVAVVPNLSSPVFAILPAAEEPRTDRQANAPRRRETTRSGRLRIDEDATLAPTFQ
jgi:hypothetical protein